MFPRTQVGDVLTLLCAVLMLAAFMFMPWYDLPDDDVTGLSLMSDEEIEIPADVSNMFLTFIPITAAAGGILALWGLLAPRYERGLPTLILLAGLLGVGYYYGSLLYENRESEIDAFSLAAPGFFIALAAAAGLILQFFLPRPVVAEPQTAPEQKMGWRARFAAVRARISQGAAHIPTLAYLVGFLAAVELEAREGETFARLLGFRKIPGLFGATDLLEPFSKLDFSGILSPFFPAPGDTVDAPLQQSWDSIRELVSTFGDALTFQSTREPGFSWVFTRVVVYDIIIYVIPVIVVALLLRKLSNSALLRMPKGIGVILQIVILYAVLYRWGDLNDYRELVLIYMGVNIMLAVSLNLVNGYMGEFSVGHAGFMAVGAYVSAILTMWAFTDTEIFGTHALSPEWGLPFGFIIALIAGGIAAALAGLFVAFPSFRTRGDYLAIVTLAVNFIVQGVINNMEGIGGPRGLNGVPLWSNLTWVFVVTVLSVLMIRNLVTSTFGKGIIAIREDEIAAELMGVNTRRVKLVAFLVSSFIAGVSGGLFGHVLAYVNPGMFGILKSTEALVMVYLGGMGSISGSIIAAVLFTILIEAFRPLAILKWVVVPLILITVMMFRPQGLFGFREIDLNFLGRREKEPQPVEEKSLKPLTEVTDDAAAD